MPMLMSICDDPVKARSTPSVCRARVRVSVRVVCGCSCCVPSCVMYTRVVTSSKIPKKKSGVTEPTCTETSHSKWQMYRAASSPLHLSLPPDLPSPSPASLRVSNSPISSPTRSISMPLSISCLKNNIPKVYVIISLIHYMRWKIDRLIL